MKSPAAVEAIVAGGKTGFAPINRLADRGTAPSPTTFHRVLLVVCTISPAWLQAMAEGIIGASVKLNATGGKLTRPVATSRSGSTTLINSLPELATYIVRPSGVSAIEVGVCPTFTGAKNFP